MRSHRVAVLVSCLIASLVLTGCDWAQFGFDSTRAAFNPFEPAFTPASVAHLSLAWSRPCGGCTERPLVAGGVVYTSSVANAGSISVRAFDAVSGTPKWSRTVTATPSFSELSAVANGVVYLIAGSSVVALDAATGVLRWRLTPPVPETGGNNLVQSLVVDGTTAFVDAHADNSPPFGEVSAIDPTGHIVWSRTPGGSTGGVVALHGTLYVVSALALTSSPHLAIILTGYDETNGSIRHAAILTGANPNDPIPTLVNTAASDGRIYVIQRGLVRNQGGMGLFAVDPATDSITWSGGGFDTYAVSPHVVVSIDGRTFQSLMSGLDPATGRVLWGPVASGEDPAVVPGIVFSATAGQLQARNLTDGSLLGSFNLPAGVQGQFFVAAAEGRLYVPDNQGNLEAIVPSGT